MSADTWFVVLGLVAVVLLVAVNGFFVATEFALVAVRRPRIEQLAERGHTRAKLVMTALGSLDSYIAAVQVGVTLASLGLGWIGEPALGRLIEPATEGLIGGFAADAVAKAASIGIAFILITGTLIVLGELAPKMISLQRTETIAFWVIVPIAIFHRVFKPFIWAMNALARLSVRPLGISPAGAHDTNLAPDELELVIESSARAGLLSMSELLIARRALEYGAIQADQIMVPRTELAAIPVEATIEEVLETVRERDHRRYPVYEGDLDHVTGILDTKDLLKLVHEDRSDWQGLVRPAVAVPESVSVEVAVTEMRARGVQVVIVIDEHGGMSGILTGDQVLDRLLGRWHGAASEARSRIQRLPNGNYLVDGLTLVADIEDIVQDELADEDYDTVGGFVMARLGRIPTVGDRITAAGHDFRVMAMDGRRVDRVLLTKSVSSESGARS